MQGAPFRRCGAGVCLLLLAASFCAQQASAATHGRQEPGSTTGEVVVTDPKLAGALQDAKAAAGKPRLFHENLVQERPLVQPDKWNWYSYDYSVFKNTDEPTDTFLGLQSVERGNLAAGVLNLTVEWKPLANLTAEMVEWMFGNLHKTAVSPFDNVTYPMYTLLHPVDHITFLAKPDPIGRGSTYTFIENPNSQCVYQPNSFDAPYTCDPDRRGFTLDTPEDVWSKYPQTNATLIVDRLDRNSCIWYRERDLPHFGKRVVITSKMTWEDSPDGLVMRASRLAGVMVPNKTDEFESASPDELLRQANEIVRVAYLDGNFNDNITQSAYAFALHWGQEWTGLKDWLPQVHAQAKKLTAAAAAEEEPNFDEEDNADQQKPATADKQPAADKAKSGAATVVPVVAAAAAAAGLAALLL